MLEKLLILLCIISETFQFCPQPCSCNDNLLSVSCTKGDGDGDSDDTSGTLDQIPIFLNPQVKSLNFMGNDIQDIGLNLQFYSSLQYLDLSKNKISSLGSSNFENLRSLKILNLSGNKLEIIDDNTFAHLTSLHHINLSHNQLKYLDWIIFRGLGHLTHIQLEYNLIEGIYKQPIMQQPQHQLYPLTLDRVKILDLSYNQLSHLNIDPFPNIENLNLAHNSIYKLNPNVVFDETRNISILNLTSNQLVGEIQFSKLVNLQVLDLSNNSIGSLNDSSFQNLFKLTFVDLSRNPISSVQPSYLQDNVHLIIFKMDHCPNLKHFDITLLDNKPFLRLFSLRHCQLTNIHFDKIHMEYIEKLDLLDNPWECNCSTIDIINYIHDHRNNHVLTNNNNNTPAHKTKNNNNDNNSPFTNNIICSNPVNLRGLSLSALTIQDFEDCFVTDHFTNTVFLITGVILLLIILILGIKIYHVYRSKPLIVDNNTQHESINHHHPHHPHYNHNHLQNPFETHHQHQYHHDVDFKSVPSVLV